MKNKESKKRRFAGRAPNTAQAATSPKQIAIAERRASVLDLRRKGYSFPTIAREVGTSVATAYRDVVESIALITREPAQEVVTLELLRLDDMQKGIYASALNGNIRAIDVLLHILDRRARLLGLYQMAADRGTAYCCGPTIKVLMPSGLELPLAGVAPGLAPNQEVSATRLGLPDRALSHKEGP